MRDYSFTRSRIFQWMGILLSLGIIAVAYWYYGVHAGVKTNSSLTDPMSNGLVGYWPLDDGTSGATPTTAVDASTNGNNGTLTSGPTWTTGQIGNAVTFDGTDDYVNIPAATNINNLATFTVSGWFYQTGCTLGYCVVAGKGFGISPTTDGWKVVSDIVGLGRKTLGFTADFSGTNLLVEASTTFTESTWNHFVVTWDGSTTASHVHIYLNGAEVSYLTQTNATGTYSSDAAQPLRIANATSVNPFTGKLDEIRLYSRTLSADEVGQLYRLTTPTGVDTSLKGYWSFNGADISGTTAYDRSGAGNNGTLTNSPAVVSGKAGQALNFFPNGADTNAYVTMGDPSSGALDFGSGDFSMALWMKGRGYSSQGSALNAIMTKKNTDVANSAGYRFYYVNDNLLIFQIGNGTTDYTITATTATVNDQQWHQYVGVRSGSTMYLYIDGVLFSSTSVSGSVSNNSDFSIGSDTNTTRNVDAILDEARVYNAALTANQIQALYKQGQSDETNTGASQPQGGSRLSSGLAGYWPLDDGTSGATPTTATDMSTNGNNGTLTNGPTWATGQIGNAVLFDGSNDFISLGTATAYDIGPGTKITTAFWYNANQANGTTGQIYRRYNGGCESYATQIIGGASTDTIAFYYRDTGCAGIDNYQIGSITKNTWHHVVSTYDTVSGVFVVYIDGAQRATTTSIPSANISYANTLYVGIESGGSNPFLGYIDELRIYKRVLSADDVANLYRLTTPTGVDTSLKGYWSFNGQDISGTTAYDQSGAGNNGTLTSGPTITQGKVGQAMNFDGSNDYMVRSTLDLSGTNKVSVAGWLWQSSFRNDDGLAWELTTNTGSFTTGFYFDPNQSSGYLSLVLVGNVGTNSATYNRPTAGMWHHYAAIYDKSQTTNEVDLYMDGVLQTAVSRGTANNTNNFGNADWYVMNRSSNQLPNAGKLDELRVYNRVLSAAEIKALYDAGASDEVNTGTSQPQGGSRLSSGLSIYYPLDDGTSGSTPTTAADSSTNGSSATLTNGPTWTTGQINNAVNFDGSNDYIALPQTTAPPNKGTVSFWANTTAAISASQSYYVYTTQTAPAGNYFNLYFSSFSSTNAWWLEWRGATGTARVAASNTYTSNGALQQWQHVVVTWDTTVGANFYVNGVLQSPTAGGVSNGSTGSFDSGTYAYALAQTFGGGAYFPGKLDDFRVYNRVLSADEIGNLYGLTSPTGTDTSLKGYWSFNGRDVSGTTAYDRSGAGNTGTLTNGPTVTPGKVGQALNFVAASTQYVNIASSASLQSSVFTYAAWINPTSYSSEGSIYGGASATPRFSVTTGGVLTLVKTGTAVIATTVASVPTNAWSYVAVTYDASGNYVFYINGVSVYSGTNLVAFTWSGGATIGQVSSNTFNGKIDEVRVYNRVLSAAEIAALYNSSR